MKCIFEIGNLYGFVITFRQCLFCVSKKKKNDIRKQQQSINNNNNKNDNDNLRA